MSTNNTIAQQNDPHELLEVFDAAGRATGVAKSRAAIHIDGDWHQAFHCWILRPGPRVVLQRRSSVKDTFPDCWDAAAAGHWRFGETAAAAAREIAEELGLDVQFADLQYVGRERLARRFTSGLIDREYHQVYVLHWAAPLVSYRPDPTEVNAVGAFASGDLLRLLGGKISSISTVEAIQVADDGAVSTAVFEVQRQEVVPYSVARVRRILGSAKLIR
ncbi:MAG TPA: NUDIX domain-containing protein [Chloroflexota bacterium]